MNRRLSIAVRPHAVIALSAVLLLPAAVHARGADDLRSAVERVQRETGGRILSAETMRLGRGQMHRIKVLTRDGSVRVYTVQGAMLREHGTPVAGRDDADREDVDASVPPSSREVEPRWAAPMPPTSEPEPAEPPELPPAPRGSRRELPEPTFRDRELDRPVFDAAPTPARDDHVPDPQPD